MAADLGGLLRVMVSSVMVADLSDMRASPTRPSARSCRIARVRSPHIYAAACMSLTAAAIVSSVLSFASIARRSGAPGASVAHVAGLFCPPARQRADPVSARKPAWMVLIG